MNNVLSDKIKENLTIPQNEEDKIESELYKNLEKNYDHADRIVRWYRNAKKAGVEEKELKSTFIDNLINIKDLFQTYENYIESLKKMKMLNKKVKIENGDKILEFDPVKDIDKIRRLEGFQKVVKAIGDTVHSGTAIHTSNQKYAITDEDRKNIRLLGFTEHVMCLSTKGYETTNKFIFQLWQNSKTLGRGDVYGDPTEQTPYCTHSKEHWDNYSEDDPNYEQYWFLERFDNRMNTTYDIFKQIQMNTNKDFSEESFKEMLKNIKMEKGDLNNENVVHVFNLMKGLGRVSLIAMNDSNNDFLDNYDESIDDIKELNHGSEVNKLYHDLFKSKIKGITKVKIDGVEFTIRDPNVEDHDEQIFPIQDMDKSDENDQPQYIVGNLTINHYNGADKIKNLEGCPQNLYGGFGLVDAEHITSLRGCPEKVEHVYINNVPLTSLEYFPKEITSKRTYPSIEIFSTNIESLKGIPENFYETLIISKNKIKNLEGCPRFLKNMEIDDEKQLESLMGISKRIMNLYIKRTPNLKSLDYLPKRSSPLQNAPVINSNDYISDDDINFFSQWFDQENILEGFDDMLSPEAKEKDPEMYKKAERVVNKLKEIYKLYTSKDGRFITKDRPKPMESKSMTLEDLIELNKKFGNESQINESYYIDEMETSKTESNKFEVEISNKIREFLDSQSDEKYKNLQVGHYEESDSKYHSDVFITNPTNNKQVWVEVKKNKYANLGGLSFKYNEGNWTCTTTNEDDPLTNFYLTALKQNSDKFISFCKEYLKKDDIKLPKDITDDLLDAWKVSGNIADTDNETQFITEKIPLEQFGFLISKFYQTAKNEPVYYIQVGDDLYIIDKNYNPLNLMTKSGSELKSLSEAYRIGRIQFRIKSMNKNDTRYFSIVNDIKILSDKENLDTDYSCSFDTKEKWPVVKGTEISESNEELKLLCNVPEDTIQNIIDNTQIENKRFERSQFTKYFGIKETNWCILASKDENLAIAAINDNTPFNEYYYIAEIQTLKKGYGKILIEELIKKYQKVWLMANTKAGEDLMNYYRKLNLNEIIIPNSVYGCPAYFYCSDDCDFDKLENYIIAFYSNEEELDEAEKDIGGEASNEIPEEGLKIWIDDIREAPEGFKWFKKVTDFVNWAYSRGTLDDVSLIDTDHDAGEYQEFGGDYIKIFDYLDKSGVKNLTIHIHSANPVGANNIRGIISRNKENGWKEIRN